MEEELTEAEQARMRSLMALQKVVMCILARWRLLFALVFCLCLAAFGAVMWLKGSRSVHRFEARTSLLFAPKKVEHVDSIGDRQLMTILERPSLKRMIAERVEMSKTEGMCLTADVKITQAKRQGNLFKLTAASKTYAGAKAKVNAYADILISEYVAYRTKDLENWRDSIQERRKGFVDQLADIEAEEATLKARTGSLSPREALVAINALISDQRKNDSSLGVTAANEAIRKRKLEASVGNEGPVVMANAAAIRRRVNAIAALDDEISSLREKYTDINPRVSGKVQERESRLAELDEFMRSKGVDGFDIEQIDHIEKAAAELAECTTRIEALEEKRLALKKELADNEAHAVEIAATAMEYERVLTRHEDIAATVHGLDEQLSGISYAIDSLPNDLRQIERTKGSSDTGPFGSKRAIVVLAGAFVLTGGLMFVIVVFEMLFGKVSGGREVAAFGELDFLGSVPKDGALPEGEQREAMSVVALKTLLACKDWKATLICELPGVASSNSFAESLDYTATMSGASCFFLDMVSSADFTPPEGAEEMICVVRNGQWGWAPVANRFAMAPTEVQMLKADIDALGETFDTIFVRIGAGLRVGGTFFDQLLELCGGALLMVESGATTRRAFATARRRLKATGKKLAAVAAGADAKSVRREMEVIS